MSKNINYLIRKNDIIYILRNSIQNNVYGESSYINKLNRLYPSWLIHLNENTLGSRACVKSLTTSLYRYLFLFSIVFDIHEDNYTN